jgi:Protein of unknown function (DUF551)
MSKTETQSRAESLAKMLEFGAFSPNLLQNEIGVRKGAAAELRRLDAENKALRERLEIDPSHPIDGIAARDETIRLLDGQILALRARLEAPAAALAAPSAGWISVDVALPPKNTEMAIWFAESTIPSTGQYTGLRADPNGWSYPSENYLSPGEHPNHPEGGYPTVTHWMELHAPGAAQAKEGGA